MAGWCGASQYAAWRRPVSFNITSWSGLFFSYSYLSTLPFLSARVRICRIDDVWARVRWPEPYTWHYCGTENNSAPSVQWGIRIQQCCGIDAGNVSNIIAHLLLSGSHFLVLKHAHKDQGNRCEFHSMPLYTMTPMPVSWPLNFFWTNSTY